MIEAITNFFNDLIETLTLWVNDFFEFFTDLFLLTVEKVFNAIVFVISSIPIPDFLTVPLQTYLNNIDSGVLWLLSVTGFSQSLAIIGTGVAFRFIRKLIPFVRL